MSLIKQFNKHLRLMFLFSIISFSLTSQTNPSTIDHFDILYNETTFFSNDTIPKVYIQSTIYLKDSANVSNINFDIIDQSDNSILYHVNYDLNGGQISGNDGKILFKKEVSTIFLNSPMVLPLKPYQYRIYTIDSYGIKSELFSEVK